MEALVGKVQEAEVFMYVVKARKGNLDRMNYDLYRDKKEHQQQEQDDHRVERDKEGSARVGTARHTWICLCRGIEQQVLSEVVEVNCCDAYERCLRTSPSNPLFLCILVGLSDDCSMYGCVHDSMHI